MESPFPELQNMVSTLQDTEGNVNGNNPAVNMIRIKPNTAKFVDEDYSGVKPRTSSSRNSSFGDINSPSLRSIRTYTGNRFSHSTPENVSELQIPIMIFDLREMDAVKGSIELKQIKLEKNQRMIRSNSLEKKLRNIYRLNQKEFIVVYSEKEIYDMFDKYGRFSDLSWEVSVDGVIGMNMMQYSNFFAIFLNAQMYHDIQNVESRLRLLLIRENNTRSKYMIVCSSEIPMGQLKSKLTSLCSEFQWSECALVYKNQKPDDDKPIGYYMKSSLLAMTLVKSRAVKVSFKYRVTEDISTCLEMQCPHTCTFEELHTLFNERFSGEASKISSRFNDGENLKISLIEVNRDILSKKTMLFYELGHTVSSHVGATAFYPVGFEDSMFFGDSDIDGSIDFRHIEVAKSRFSLDIDISTVSAFLVRVQRMKMGMKLKPLYLMIRGEEKITDLKTKLKIYTKIPVDAQKLSCGNTLLETDNLTASQLGIFKPGEHTLLFLEEYQPFNITVKLRSNEYSDLQMKLYAGTKIFKIKQKIADHVGCHIWQVLLHHNEIKVSLTRMDNKTLSQCSIAQSTTLVAEVYKQSIRVAIKSTNQNIHNDVLFITNPNERYVKDIKSDIANKGGIKKWTVVNLIYDSECLDDDKILSSYGIDDGSKIWASINPEGQLKTRIFECEANNGTIHESAGIVIGGHILKGTGSLTPEVLQLLLDQQASKDQNPTPTPALGVQPASISTENEHRYTPYVNHSGVSHKDVEIQTNQTDHMASNISEQRRPLLLNMNMSNSNSSVEDSAFLSSELDSASPCFDKSLCTSQPTNRRIVTPETRPRCGFVEPACHKGSGHPTMCSSTSVSQNEVITNDVNGRITSTCQHIITTTGEATATSATESFTVAGQSNGCDIDNTSTVIASNQTMTSLVSEGNQLTVKHSQHSTWNVCSTDMSQLSLSNNNLQLDLQSNEPLQKGLKSLGVMDSSRSTLEFIEPMVISVDPPINFVNDKLLCHVAKELGRGGKELGRLLGLEESELDAARSNNNQNTVEFNNQMLRKWKEKVGYNATKEKLAGALEQSGKMNIVHKYLSDSASESEGQK